MDTASYRDARTHLIKLGLGSCKKNSAFKEDTVRRLVNCTEKYEKHSEEQEEHEEEHVIIMKKS